MKVAVGAVEQAANQTVQQAVTNGFNMVHIGKTQTGKTSTARELHATTPRTVSIWLNEPGDDRVPNIASEGNPVRSIKGVRKALADNQLRINFISSDRQRDVAALQRLLWDVSDRADRRLSMQVIIDELHRVAPQTNEREHEGRDAVRRFAKEGVKRGAKFVGITQDPTSMDKQTLRQAEYRAVWPMSAENQTSSVLQRMKIDWDRVNEGSRYTGILHHDSGKVLGEVRASKKYA